MEVIMTDEINQSETRKKSFYTKLSKLGNFRRGTISIHYRKCGKENCICTKPDHPGHGPQYLWTTTIKGKSYAKNLKLGPELQKYKEETDNYRLFMDIYKEIILVNEKICDLRPTADVSEKEMEILKKKLLKYYSPKFKKK
jgi:hypothetical protein